MDSFRATRPSEKTPPVWWDATRRPSGRPRWSIGTRVATDEQSHRVPSQGSFRNTGPGEALSATRTPRSGLDDQDDRQADADADDEPGRAARDGAGTESAQGGNEISPVTRHPFSSSGLRGTFLNAGPALGGSFRNTGPAHRVAAGPHILLGTYEVADSPALKASTKYWVSSSGASIATPLRTARSASSIFLKRASISLREETDSW